MARKRTLIIRCEAGFVDVLDDLARRQKTTRADILGQAIRLLSTVLDKAEQGLSISFVPAEPLKAIVTNDDAFASAVVELSKLEQKSPTEVIRYAVDIYYRAVKEYGNGEGILFIPMQTTTP